MEDVKDVTMRLRIETDKRTVQEEFDNLFDLKLFMDSFFLEFGNRRSRRPSPNYTGPERRMML